MKNKFAGFFILLLFSLVIFNASCKKSEGEGVYVITSGEGRVDYDGIAFTTDLFFGCTVLNQSDIPGTITGWKLVYKSGSTQVLEIASENCASYNMDAFAKLLVHPYKERIIVGKSVPALNKVYFNASTIPDHMDISVTVMDDNENKAIIHFNAPVTYSEYND